jgi:hypothetical protein
MDFVKNLAGGGDNNENEKANADQQKSNQSGGFLGGIGDKLNAAAGGGPESEKNEDCEQTFLKSYKSAFTDLLSQILTKVHSSAWKR